MESPKKPRKVSFLTAVSWLYLVLSLAMIGLAIYALTSESIRLTFGGVTDAVFAAILGVVGSFAAILGLIGKNLRRCRILGLILLLISAVPLTINLLASQPFSIYWKNVASLIVPFLYFIAALFTRSPKPAEASAEPVVLSENRAEAIKQENVATKNDSTKTN